MHHEHDEIALVIAAAIGRLADAFDHLARVGVYIMDAIDRLEAAVSRNESAEDSVLAVLTAIGTELKKYQGLDDRLDAYTARLSTRADAMAAAVVANTPAATAPADAPVSAG